VLEIPYYLKDIKQNLSMVNNYIEDLDIYIKNIKPKIIIIQKIEILFKDNTNKMNTTSLSKFLNYLYDLGMTVVVDISNFEKKEVLVCEKFATGIFEFTKITKTENNLLAIKFPHKILDDLSIIFSIDVDDSITTPRFKNISTISINECKQIVLPTILNNYEKIFNEIFSQQLEYTYYNSYEDIKNLKIDNKFSIILISAHNLSDSNGWQLLTWIKKNYPLAKIIFSGSIYRPTYQKIRAIEMGADKSIIMPIPDEDFKSIVTDMYRYDETDNFKVIHHIMLLKKEFIKSENFSIIYKNTFAKFLKEYTYNIMSQGISLHFFKLFSTIENIDDLPDILKNNKSIIFISTYYIEHSQALFLLYKRLTTKEKNKILIALKEIAENSIEQTQDNKTKSTAQNSNVYEVYNIDYPVDELDIDVVLDWIYD
jgi:hypothetical protein